MPQEQVSDGLVGQCVGFSVLSSGTLSQPIAEISKDLLGRARGFFAKWGSPRPCFRSECGHALYTPTPEVSPDMA